MSKIHWGKSTYGMMRYMRMVSAGHYKLEWWGDTVTIDRLDNFAGKQALWEVRVNGDYKHCAGVLDAAMDWVANVWGNEPVMTYNMLNRKAGEFPIARKDKGGCCDPATETYHCM